MIEVAFTNRRNVNMLDALGHHWPEYLMEAGLLGCFMLSACLFGTLLGHPDSPVVQHVRGQFLRRMAMGVAMGLTAVVLIYSPWGQQSGAHMNPATTLTFFLRGKVSAWDAIFYILAQFAGGVAGVAVSRILLRDWLRHAAVDHVVTMPGRYGVTVAWAAELAIAFVMMFVVLYASNDNVLTPYTGFFAGALVALYIAFEAPLSGMSLNPARTFASAFVARHWKSVWIYLTAPIAGMFLASAMYATLPNHNRVYCAKLSHRNTRRCIFHCQFDQLGAMRIDAHSHLTIDPIAATSH